MDFDIAINSQCSFCNQPITSAPLESFDGHHFCTAVCAKLYHDNIQQIKVNMSEYRKLYKTQQLSQHAMEIYEKINDNIFYMLPIMKFEDNCNDDRLIAKNNYTNVLLKLKNKIITK